jgi:hypothetical protein
MLAEAVFRVLEAMFDPLCRDIPEQADLVTRLNRHLVHDGYSVDEVHRTSSGAALLRPTPFICMRT